MPKLAIDIEARLAQFQDSLAKIERDAGGVARQLETAFGGLSTALGALGATVSVGAFAAFVKDGIAAQAALDDLAQSTTLTVETLSKLRDLARITGVDLGQVSSVAARVARSVGEAAGGNEALVKAFADLGISVRDLQSLSPDQIFERFSSAISTADNQQRAFAVGAAIAGRSLQELAPFLRDVAERGLGVASVTADQAKAAADLEDAVRELGGAFDTLKLQLASGVVPILREVLDDFTTGIRLAGSFSEALRLFGVGINPFRDLPGNLAAVREELDKLQAQRRLRVAGAEFTGDLDERIADAQKQLEFLKAQQARAALAGRTGPEFQDGRDRAVQGAGRTRIGDSSLRTGQPERPARAARGESDAARGAREFEEERERRYRQAVAEANREIEDRNKLLSDELRAQRQLIDAIDEQERLDREAGLAANGGRSALQALEEQQRRNVDVARELGLTFTSAFEDAVVAGKDLSDVLEGLGQDFARLILRQTVTQPLANAASEALKGLNLGNLFGGLFGGARADGGPVFAGRAYLVGERGPELFVPRSAGNIVPNGAGGASITNVYNIDARADRAAIVAEIRASEQRTLAQVLDARTRGGQFARAF